MTLKVRRMLSLIFIILFLTISPAVILYAAGYKLGKDGFSVRRTGLFIVESKPRGAKIFLNGKAQKTMINSLLNRDNYITTPVKIKNLLPGEYELALELEGYLSWRKVLTINPGASAYAKDINLFKTSLPLLITPSKIKALDFSLDGKTAVIISADQLTFLNLADESKKSISQNYLEGKNIVWSSDGQKLIIDNYFFKTDDLNFKIDLSKLTAGAFNYRWYNDVLFYQDSASIYQLDHDNLPKKIIGNIEFKDYLVKAGYLYIINQTKPAASLKIIELASNKEIKEINLPAAASYLFINPEQALLNLYDDSHKTLYLINPLAAYFSPLVEIINNLRIALWADDNRLLYANDFEIWQYDLAAKKKTLLTRISDPINRVVAHPNNNYIIYATPETINVIELDEREKRNISELAKFDSIDSLVLNPEGDSLYFSGRVGQTEGLYKLLIQ